MAQPSFIIDLYDSLVTATDERSRARIIASAFERLEDRYPELRDLATASGVRESELRLQKEIEQVRSDLTEKIEQVRADLTEKIEQVRSELRIEIEKVRAELGIDIQKVRADLGRDIEKVRADLGIDIEKLRTELTATIHETKTELQHTIQKGNMTVLRWMVSLMMVQIFTILVAVFTVIWK
jgi:uncharacterized protein (UPF0210 family)